MSSTKVCEGQWYVDRAHHEFFLVIGIDESDGLIDVRDRYGDIDEFDLDEWDAMDLALCTAPGEGDGEWTEVDGEWTEVDGEWTEDEDAGQRPAS